MFKLAIIRDNEEIRCPFGLPIASACKIAGESVDNMQYINDFDDIDAKQIIDNNIIFLSKNPEPKKCKYASHLFKNKPNMVDCDFGDTAAGLNENTNFLGSPYYSQIGEGLGVGGLMSYPITYQTDGTEYRNLYYGLAEYSSDRRCLKSILRQALLQTLKIDKS